ncbi:MAG: dihydroorotase [Dehalococcoidia bacterium]
MNGDERFLLIQGGRIVDPGRGIDRVGDILISGGRIVKAGDAVISGSSYEAPGKVQCLEATGLVVCPGFVDLHCHLRDPGFEHKETIATGTAAAAKGGFTTVCCMGNTEPPLDTPAAVDRVREKASTEALVMVLPIGCITRGRKGHELTDMAGLARAGVVAFSDDGDPVADPQIMRAAMTCSHGLGLPIIDHCEDKTLSGRGVMNEGPVSTATGLVGIPPAAEEVMVDRDLTLARLTGARIHIAHVSTRGSVELIRRAREEGVPVTCEVTPHHLTLTEDRIWGDGKDKRLDTNARVNPPLRTRADLEALIGGLRDGVIDAIATDHAPHAAADKDCEFELAAPGISGFETALGCLMTLVHEGDLSLAWLLSRLTIEPSRIIGRDREIGTLNPGNPANITVLDPGCQWTVDSRRFASRGRNTPYDGWRFKGKVMATIVDGRTAYMDDAMAHRALHKEDVS